MTRPGTQAVITTAESMMDVAHTAMGIKPPDRVRFRQLGPTPALAWAALAEWHLAAVEAARLAALPARLS